MIRIASVALLLAVLAAGCVGSDEAADPSDEAPTASTCDQVRAGIDAFNDGDYVQTQELFRTALPLATRAAERDPSKEAADLLEAVKYYADLAPDDYPESARSSADFEKYKRITLGQCVPPVDDPQSPGTEV